MNDDRHRLGMMERTVTDLARGLERVSKEHAEVLNRHERYIQEQEAAKFIDVQKEVVAHAFEKANSYFQGVIVGGYAGYFALWAYLSDKMAKSLHAGSGLLMASSLILFVAYTIFSHMHGQRHFMKKTAALLSKVPDPLAVRAELEKQDQQAKGFQIAAARHWAIALVVTLVPAVLAITLLMWGFGAFVLGELLGWRANVRV